MASSNQSNPMVIVRVPATSANVGVGFDCLGLALTLTATFLMTPADKLTIDGCEDRFKDENNLVWQSYLKACEKLGLEARPLHITILSPSRCQAAWARVLPASSRVWPPHRRSLPRLFSRDLPGACDSHRGPPRQRGAGHHGRPGELVHRGREDHVDGHEHCR